MLSSLPHAGHVAIFASLFLPSTALAKGGYIASVQSNGVTYRGARPGGGGDPVEGPIRLVTTSDPLHDPKTMDIACGAGVPRPAAMNMPINAGSTLSINWVSDEGGVWQYDVGPMITYLTPCSNPQCSDDGLNARWFKIAQAGQKPNDPHKWIQEGLTRAVPYDMVIPSGIPTGQWLMRHEIIELGNSSRPGGALFFPACIQLNVTNAAIRNQDSPFNFAMTIPLAEQTTFPGGYAPNDKGILVDVVGRAVNYNALFPGPNIPDELTNVGDGREPPPPSTTYTYAHSSSGVPTSSSSASKSSSDFAPSSTKSRGGELPPTTASSTISADASSTSLQPSYSEPGGGGAPTTTPTRPLTPTDTPTSSEASQTGPIRWTTMYKVFSVPYRVPVGLNGDEDGGPALARRTERAHPRHF